MSALSCCWSGHSPKRRSSGWALTGGSGPITGWASWLFRQPVPPGGGAAWNSDTRAAAQIAGKKGTLLVDGTVCPLWDWSAITGLFSGKAGDPSMNARIAATMAGDLAAVGPIPVPGARHDAHAFAASGLQGMLAGVQAAAGIGYTGVEGIGLAPFRTPPGGKLHASQAAFNTGLSKIRAAVERAIAHLKTWRMLSEEAAGSGRRCAIRVHPQSHHRPVLLQQLL